MKILVPLYNGNYEITINNDLKYCCYHKNQNKRQYMISLNQHCLSNNLNIVLFYNENWNWNWII